MIFTKAEQARLQELANWHQVAEAQWQAIEAAPDYKFVNNDPRDPYYNKFYIEMIDLQSKKWSIEKCAAYPVGTQVNDKSKTGKPLQGVIVEHRNHSDSPGNQKAYLRPVVQWVGFKRKSMF